MKTITKNPFLTAMKSNPINRFLSTRAGALTSFILLPMALPVSAANLYWEGIGESQSPLNPPSQPLPQWELWQTAANWDTLADGTGGAPIDAPITGDIAIFNTTVNNGTRGARLNASRSIDGLIINNTGTTGIAAETSAVRALLIGASGLTVNSGAGAVTFGTGSRPLTMRLLASQTWLNSSSALVRHLNGGSTDTNLDLQGFTLTVDGTGPTTFASGAMTGSNAVAVIKGGTGVLTFNVVDKDALGVGSAAFTGDVQINAGTVQYGVASALPSTADVVFNTTSGTATLDLNGFSGTIGALTIDGAAGSGAAITTGAGTLTLGGNVTYNGALGTPGGATITGKLDLGAATRTFEVRDSGVAEELLVGADISGTGVGLTKTSTGALILGGVNNFDGPVVVREGVFSVNSLVGVGTGVIQLGFGTRTGILRYTGAATGTNRQIQLGRTNATENGGGVIENNGGGALTFSNAAFNVPVAYDAPGGATRNLNLRGSNTDLNTISGVIADNDAANGGIVTLTKEGSGTWVLAGANSYTGTTTVNAGTLALNGSSIDNSNQLTINSGVVNLTGVETVNTLFFGAAQQAAGTWGSSSSAAVPPFVDDTRFSGTGTLFVSTGPAPVGGYDAWQSANSTDQAANLDHDNDGVSNGVEHFLGGVANTTGFTTPLPGVVDTTGVLSVTWVRHPDFPGFPANYGTAFLVETSATLADPWTPETVGVNVAITGNNVKYTFPAGTKNFARLKVVAP